MKRRGFTLIEIMIAVAIVGVLAAIAVPQYRGYIKKSKLEKLQVPMESIAAYMEMRAAEGKSLPSNLAGVPEKMRNGVSTTGSLPDNVGTVTLENVNQTAKTYTIKGELTGYTGSSISINEKGQKTSQGDLNWIK